MGGDAFFGPPTQDEQSTPDRSGRFRMYANASIYWSPATGAHVIQGAIRDKWQALGGVTGLGYPLTDETATPDGVGRYNHFQKDASIYWTPTTGAHAVYGSIRDKWAELGWEKAF